MRGRRRDVRRKPQLTACSSRTSRAPSGTRELRCVATRWTEGDADMGALKELVGFNASRWRLRSENAAFAADVPAGAYVLDAGAGEAPYRALFDHAHYESADFEQVAKPYGVNTYVCDLA